MIYREIINKIEKNRISTTEVADCLGKTGALADLFPLNKRHFRVGKVFFCYAYNESNWELHEQITNISEDRALFGSIVSKYLLLYKQAKAIIVNGMLRDAHTLIKENYPIWCKGVSPIGCYNRKNSEPLGIEIHNSLKNMYEGTIAVCDDSGVVIIPKSSINESFLEKLDFIEEQEDIWFDCIDRKKWSTFDTVCLKKYLDDD
jgi:4-hydroxy-4-methyl-2-oxoglutarate aldolase